MHSTTYKIETTKTNQNTNTDTTGTSSGITKVVASLLVLWFALVTFVAGRGGLIGSPGSPPLALLLSVVTPAIVFLVAYWVSATFRHFVLTFDLRLAAGIQAWRFAGLGFLALYTNGVLPGVFAWPAGVGDMIVGMTAPWVMLALIRRPDFLRSKWFLAWNLFGMLDLITAVTDGGLASFLIHEGGVSTGPMARLPLAYIPAYFVPILFMLHLTALFQRRRSMNAVRESGRT